MKVVCKCKHTEQDKLHGKQVRVANKTAAVTNDGHWYKCTVCGASHRGE